MKNIFMLAVAMIAMTFSINAQVFNLTTGVPGAPGGNDTKWSVKVPGSTVFVPAKISTGLVQSGSNTYNPYAQNSCGRWITPYITSTNNVQKPPSATSQGVYTYRMRFYVSGCPAGNSSLSLSFAAADNRLDSLRINNLNYTIPSGIAFNPASSFSVPSITNITTGWNTIEFDVYNIGSWTALQLCGNLNVKSYSKTPPKNLGCCLSPAGQVLSWSPVPGAIGYEVIITWNDPKCCPKGTKPPTGSMYVTSQNALVLSTVFSSCFSWKVRAVYPNGCKTNFSDTKCSCSKIVKPAGKKDGSETGVIIKKSSTIEVTARPNPANNTFSVQMHDHSNETGFVNAVITIVDFSGKEVYNSPISMEELKEINVSQLAAGIYLYKIIDADKNELIKSDKLIIK